MATSQTSRSTPLLSELARHVVIPKGIKTTAWPHIVAQCAEMGVGFDPWQHGVGKIALGKRADGKYAATVGGVVLSIPRQVGKTFLVGMIVIALCILHPGMKVIWTAHRTRTATNTFRALQGMARRKKVAPYIDHIRTANGEQEIGFRNGSVIMFGAREQGFGRGFDEVDVEVFDEAQILTAKALEDMVAATNQSRHPAGALLFFMGTPPRPTDPGEEFTNRRKKALSGRAENMVYVEFSADQDADPDDRVQWRRANPSFPARTPVESVERLREQLTDDDSFMREALGIWDAAQSGLIDMAQWRTLADRDSEPFAPLMFAVSVAPGQERASVVLAGRRLDGLPHLEVIEQASGAGWVPDRLAELDRKWSPAGIMLDPGGPSGGLLSAIIKAGVDPKLVSGREYAQACGGFLNAVNTSGLRHQGDARLTSAVDAGRKRSYGDQAWVWHWSTPADITPLVAATLALHGLDVHGQVKPKSKAAFGF